MQTEVRGSVSLMGAISSNSLLFGGGGNFYKGVKVLCEERWVSETLPEPWQFKVREQMMFQKRCGKGN